MKSPFQLEKSVLKADERSPHRNPVPDSAPDRETVQSRIIGTRWSECVEGNGYPCTPEELRTALDEENLRLYQMLYV